MFAEDGWGREGFDVCAQVGHCATEHDGLVVRRELLDITRCTPPVGRTEPSTEIVPVVDAVLDGGGGENPATDRVFSGIHTVPPSRGSVAVPNGVSLIENDTTEFGGADITVCAGNPVMTDLIVGGEIDGSCSKRSGRR